MSIQHIALVLEASGLSAQEKAVLTAFCNHTDPSGKTFAGEERLMREAGMPRATFRRWRSQLVDRELLISRRKGRKGGGRTTSDTWVNIEKLRAARDPFFGQTPTDRPEDENPFAQVGGNGPAGETKGGFGLTSEPINQPTGEPINGPVSETTVGSPVRPITVSESLSGSPQGEPSSSVPPSPSAAVERAPEEEGGGGGSIDLQQQDKQHAEAVEFLRDLPGQWAAGRQTAERLAPLLLAAVRDGGWQLDAELAAKLTENPGGIRSYRAVLPVRIEELPRRTRPQAPASTGHRPFQCPPAGVYELGFDGLPLPAARPPWCGDPDCSEVDRMRDVELPDGLRGVTPCRECHPEAAAVPAQVGAGLLPGTDTKVAGWLALPTGA